MFGCSENKIKIAKRIKVTKIIPVIVNPIIIFFLKESLYRTNYLLFVGFIGYHNPDN